MPRPIRPSVEMRWPETNGGEAVCPLLRLYDETYKHHHPPQVQVQRIATTNSAVTSGTIFASRKMDFVDLLGRDLHPGERLQGRVHGPAFPRFGLPIQDSFCSGPQTAGSHGLRRSHGRGSGRSRGNRRRVLSVVISARRTAKRNRKDRRLQKNTRRVSRRVVVASAGT